MRLDPSSFIDAFKAAAQSREVAVATGLTIAMKFVAPVGKVLGQLGKNRRARRLRQEITALQQFQTTVPNEVQTVVAHQLEKLYRRYTEMFATREVPFAVYPTVPLWRRPLLLYVPARKRALIPQFLFYALVPFALHQFVKNSSWQDFVGLSAFAFLFRDWAKRSEQPRNERTLFERIFLAYPSPPGTSNKMYRVFLGLAVLLMIPTAVVSSPLEIAEEILGTLGILLAFNDYVRSYDVELPTEVQPPETSKAQKA